LERLDRFRGKEIVILSLATGGYKQPQQLMALTYLLALGAHFDLVINVDGFNEVALPAAENVPQGYSPYYPRGWQLQVGPLDMEQRKLVGRISYQRDRRAAWAKRFLEPPWRYSWLAAAV
jgi:hypothetical protein